MYVPAYGMPINADILAYNETNHSDPSFVYDWDGVKVGRGELWSATDDYSNGWYFTLDINAFSLNPNNARYTPENLLPVPASVLNGTLTDETWQPTNGGSGISASAIIQAGGRVDINAPERIDNGSIYLGAAYTAGSAPSVGTAVNGSTQSIGTIGSQLPPDLAQQQVNPLVLPGFALPTGSNGLFRLSGQERTQSDAQTITGGDEYTFTGQSIALSQRERALNGTDSATGNITLDSSAIAQSGSGAISFTVAQVQGIPGSAWPDSSHKYLIETNPALTSLTSFLSSDYLLGLLGYDPDKAQKRLGDGLYEQRLIQQAVMARTGERFIASLNNDADMFKYLMDNAIAYKDRLQLSLGVGLSAEQVAALTHDIVWLEEATVNGEKVLVPVLYLAQADGRLAPNGALIMGQDVSLKRAHWMPAAAP